MQPVPFTNERFSFVHINAASILVPTSQTLHDCYSGQQKTPSASSVRDQEVGYTRVYLNALSKGKDVMSLALIHLQWVKRKSA